MCSVDFYDDTALLIRTHMNPFDCAFFDSETLGQRDIKTARTNEDKIISNE